MCIAYSAEKELPQEPLHRLFQAVGWSDSMQEITPEMLRNFNLPFRNSTFVFSAWHGEILVGCVRVLSDKIFRSVIYDLAVLPEYQGKGIGAALVQMCMDQVPGSEWLAQTTPERVSYYEKLGFRRSGGEFLHIPCKWF